MRLFSCTVLSVVLSELAFLGGYVLTYTVHRYLEIGLIVHLRRRVAAWVNGILCGASGGFSALTVAYLIARQGRVADAWFLVVSMILPAAGMFAYFEQKLRQVAKGGFRIAPVYSRLHGVMMGIPERIEFDFVKRALEQARPDQIGLEGDPLGHFAYQQMVGTVLTMTIFSFVGTAIGISIAVALFAQ
jgi:hypothetical protein